MRYFNNLLLVYLLACVISCGQDQATCQDSPPANANENNEGVLDATEQSEDQVENDDDGLCDGPQAIGRIANCEESETTHCNSIQTQALAQVSLDGSRSYDPTGGTIVNYQWDVIVLPADSDPSALDWSGSSSTGASLLVPSIGNYRVCLTVFNDSGIMHCNTEGNCVDILAE